MKYCADIFQSLSMLVSSLKPMEEWWEETMQVDWSRIRLCVQAYGGQHYIKIIRDFVKHAILVKGQESLHEEMNYP